MALNILWNDAPGEVSGSTPFGYFDSENEFQEKAPRAARWAARRLGFPSVDVEMNDVLFYSCFEEAIIEYSAQVQQFTIRENMLSLMGTSNEPTDSLTNVPINQNMQYIINISKQYGAESGVGGDITWRKASIEMVADQQDYDLNELISVAKESGKAIEIKRIYHFAPVAYGFGMAGAYNSPGVLGNAGVGNAGGFLANFGMEGLAAGGLATGLSYTMMPVFEDLLRMQAVEFNMQIRRSGYGFELRNNILRILPVPRYGNTIWIDYVLVEDKYTGTPNNITGSFYNSGRSTSVTTNLGDAPYRIMEFSRINEPGRRWIQRYFLACCKETLGEIRSKYQNIPIMGAEYSLNGDSLKQEGQTEKQDLRQELREDLERTSTQTQMQIQSENATNLQTILSKVPLPIYIH